MKNYQITLIFVDEQRALVSVVAEHLATEFGRVQISYERYYGAGLASSNLGSRLVPAADSRAEHRREALFTCPCARVVGCEHSLSDSNEHEGSPC